MLARLFNVINFRWFLHIRSAARWRPGNGELLSASAFGDFFIVHCFHFSCSWSIYILSVTDFDPKGTISEVRVHAGLYLDILDADRSPNAVSFHVGNAQVDFEVDRPPPANSAPGDLLITMVKETVTLYKKKEFRKMKKSRISHWSEGDEKAKWLRDCLWLCQACKCGFTCRPMWRNLCQEAHSYPQADICSAPHSDHGNTHTHI